MAETRYIGDVPGVKSPRANFNLSHRVATTMKPGLLHPIDIVEVLPGDTWTIDSAQLVKLSTPLIRPIMDDVYLDTYSFFVPLRLTYSDLEDVFGNSSPSAYEENELALIPGFELYSDRTGNNLPPSGGVMDYLGYPCVSSVPSGLGEFRSNLSILPVRAFALIWNEFFRNQQVDQECNVNLSGTVASTEMPNANAWSPTNYSGMLPPVRRYGDYFSTAMLAPQKGPAVKIPFEGTPIVATTKVHPMGDSLKFNTASGASSPYYLGLASSGYVNSYPAPSGTLSGSVNITQSTLVVGDSTDGTINAL